MQKFDQNYVTQLQKKLTALRTIIHMYELSDITIILILYYIYIYINVQHKFIPPTSVPFLGLVSEAIPVVALLVSVLGFTLQLSLLSSYFKPNP